jgi:hypothetical protein
MVTKRDRRKRKRLSSTQESASARIASIASFFSGTLEKRVAVLGAFDTWPYMDFISRLLAENNYIALTSRWIYRKFGKRVFRFDILEHPQYASDDLLSALLDRIISNCSYAIVNFSVSAAHFIETDWCYHKGKRTLGIAYVRSAFDPSRRCCAFLHIRDTPAGEYSECSASAGRTAWQCIREPCFCPFIEQGISKNVIEYFFRGDKMRIVAVENFQIIPHVLTDNLVPLTVSQESLGTIETEIVKRHETVFRKLPISVVLLVNQLLQGKVYDRASKLRLLASASTVHGLNMSKAQNSAMMKSTKYLKELNQGFVDFQVVADMIEDKSLADCANELVRVGFLEQRELEFLPGQKARLVRLTKIGEKYIDFLNGLQQATS